MTNGDSALTRTSVRPSACQESRGIFAFEMLVVAPRLALLREACLGPPSWSERLPSLRRLIRFGKTREDIDGVSLWVRAFLST